MLNYGFGFLTGPRHNPVETRVQHLDRLIQAIPAGELVETPAAAPDSPKEVFLPATVTKTTAEEKAAAGLTTDETIQYQRREIGKELLLLEKHLQQGCKIAGKGGQVKACDCCTKHPLAIEALAQETLGMTPDLAFSELILWVRSIETKTTEAASASGQYDKEYPKLAIKARELRKAIIGTESASALLAKEGKDAETNISTKQETSEPEE